MNENRKYYGVILEDDKAWGILFNHVIDQSKFFEFGIGVDTTDPHFDNMNKNIPEMPELLRKDRETQFKNALNDLKKTGLKNNINCFYSTKTIFNLTYPYDWHVGRLKLDEKLKASLRAKQSLMDYFDSDTNNYHFEFENPAFYGDEKTALMFSIHTEMKAYILLNAAEKAKLEQQGIEFSEEIEEINQNEKKGLISLEELKAL